MIATQTVNAQKSSLVIVKPAKDSIIMPNVLKGQNLELKYQSNNGQGFDIYESGFDRMPVLIPDKNNAASLGIHTIPKQPSIQFRKYQPELPKNQPGLLIQKDSLLIGSKKFKK